VRSILESIGVIVIPDQKAVSSAYSAFDEAGNLKDGDQRSAIEAIGAKLADVVAKLNA
jgi:chromate reductase, NAD(P)H dehydrogenase (quinone)